MSTQAKVADPAAEPASHRSAATRHLLGRLGVIEERLRRVLAQEQAGNGSGDDDRARRFALPAEVDRVVAAVGGPTMLPVDPAADAALAMIEGRADVDEEGGVRLPLRSLGLSGFEQEVLLIAAAPALDQRFGDLFGRVPGNGGLRAATVGTALRLCGVEPVDPGARTLLGPRGRLVRGGLVDLDEAAPTLLDAAMVVPERVIVHLLGSDGEEPALAGVLAEPRPVASQTALRVARLLGLGVDLVHVRDRIGVGATSAAEAALLATGHDVVTIDLSRLHEKAPTAEIARAATREAILRGAGLVVGPVDGLAQRDVEGLRGFADLPVPTVVHGRSPWDPAWAGRAALSVDADRLDLETVTSLWRDALGTAFDDGMLERLVEDTAAVRLTPRQIDRAGEAAARYAAAEDRPVATEDVHRGIRAQNGSGLQRLARRVEPQVTWDDLIVAPAVEEQLREIPMRWHHRDRVLEDWGTGRGVATGRGVSALFAGASGTGKTLAAEVIAGDLGLDLYLVDLSTVVDKYIGETSKNLERIFDEADRLNGVLLFDEADALFGKRSAVGDSKDRHANVEVAYLLQRIETFDGVVILTTNLASNLDDAFLRRFHAIVDFPAPTQDGRRALWEAKLSHGMPLADDVDVDELAELFTLSGAEIANVVMSAAFWAASHGGAVGMADLVAAAVREHRKLGKHLTAADLGNHARLLG